MLATSTHDTKRSEDVRARLALLSEIPALWAGAVMRFSKLQRHKPSADAPGPNTDTFSGRPWWALTPSTPSGPRGTC